MSEDQHHRAQADHTLANGALITISDDEVIGKKRHLSFKELRGMRYEVGVIALSVTLPKGQSDWKPDRTIGVVIDGEHYRIDDVKEWPYQWRFVASRYGS